MLSSADLEISSSRASKVIFEQRVSGLLHSKSSPHDGIAVVVRTSHKGKATHVVGRRNFC
jgi:hypothetical protein